MECEKCLKTFTTNDCLKAHLCGLVWECQVCRTTFKHTSSKSRHQRKSKHNHWKKKPLDITGEVHPALQKHSLAPKSTPNSKTVEEKIPKRVCGLVIGIDQDDVEIFYIKCNYCDVKYHTADWTYFINHIKETHPNTVQRKKSTLINSTSSNERRETAQEKCLPEGIEFEKPKHVDIGQNPTEQEKIQLLKIYGTKKNPTEKTNIKISEIYRIGKNREKSPYSENSSESDEESKNSDPDNLSDIQKLRKRKNVADWLNNKCKKKTKNYNLVSFDHPEEKCVIDFLKLLKFNPILWQNQSIMERYDEALEKITTGFNIQWPKYRMTCIESRSSINQIYNRYQRINDIKQKGFIADSPQLKFTKYFELCNAIEKSSPMERDSCENCQIFYTNDIEHEVLYNQILRIGDLNLNCSPFKNDISRDEKETDHEQKHQTEQIKSFGCDICHKRLLIACS